MNVRWLWGNYIDPEWRLTRAQVRMAHRLVHKRYMRPFAMWGMTGMLVIAALLLYRFCIDAISIFMAQIVGLKWAWLSSATLIGLLAIVFAAWMYRLIYVRPLRRAMRDLGYDLCTNCGYWLRGLGKDVTKCPECGAQRQPMTIAQAEQPKS